MTKRHDLIQLPAGEFKAKCLRLMDEVKLKRQQIIITKHGKPVAKLVPIDEPQSEIFGYMAETGLIVGDIVGPLDERWEVNE